MSLAEKDNKEVSFYTHVSNYSPLRIKQIEDVARLLNIVISIKILPKEKNCTSDTNFSSSNEYTIKTRKKIIKEDIICIKLEVYGNHRLLFFGPQALEEATDSSGNFNEEVFRKKIRNWLSQ